MSTKKTTKTTKTTKAADQAKAPEAESKPRKAKPEKAKKVSALDAAARVLAEAKEPMNCQEMIKAMAGYWTSPGGKTPAATLYSAVLKETLTKGTQSRFTKTGRGKFGLAARG